MAGIIPISAKMFSLIVMPEMSDKMPKIPIILNMLLPNTFPKDTSDNPCIAGEILTAS